MLATYAAIIMLAFLSGITTLIGVALALHFKKSIIGVSVGIGFSTGIMLAISLFELVPEAVAATSLLYALVSVLLGFTLIFSLDFIIPHTHIIKEKGKLGSVTKVAYLVAFGLVLHDFPEGFAMANSYIYAPALGLLVAVAIAIHNIPEEFAMAVPLVMIKKKAALIKIALISALAEPAGAVLGLAAVSIASTLNPFFMAFAAGAMIFVSIHELTPLARKYEKMHYFALGIGLSLLTYLALTLII